MCDGDDCCKRLCKFLLVVFNLFFFLLGLLMLAFGIAMVAAPDKVAEAVAKTGAPMQILGNVDYVIKGAGIFAIILGGAVALIGGFGFFGACCEIRCLLVLYLILVIVILLAEVALIIFAACYPSNLRGEVQKELNKTLIDRFADDIDAYNNTIGSTPTGISWALTQIGTKCCGAFSPEDYTNPYRYNGNKILVHLPDGTWQNSKYPLSCCALKTTVSDPSKVTYNDFVNVPGCMSNATVDAVNRKNCYDQIETMIMSASNIAIGIAAAIVGLEIIIIILGFILCCAIQRSKSLTV